MTGQAFIILKFGFDQMCDLTFDDTHDTAFALPDAAAARERHTSRQGGIEQRALRGIPAEIPGAAVDGHGLRFQFGGTDVTAEKDSAKMSKRGMPISTSRAVIVLLKPGEPQM